MTGRGEGDSRKTKPAGENFVYADAVNYILSAYLTAWRGSRGVPELSKPLVLAALRNLPRNAAAQPWLRCLARLVIRLQGRSELLGNGIAMEMGTKMGPSAVGCGKLVAAVATVSPLSFNSPSSSSALW